MVSAIDVHWPVSGEDHPGSEFAVYACQMSVQELVLYGCRVKCMLRTHQHKVNGPIVKSIPEQGQEGQYCTTEETGCY